MMPTNRPLRLALAALTTLATIAALTLAPAARSEDIDIYSGGPPSTVAPNILFYIDNTANWSSPFPWEKGALKTVFELFLPATVNAGLMMFTETGGGNSGPDGAYVRFPVLPMNATNQPALAAIVDGLDVNNDKSNNGKLGIGMAEVYRYLAGKAAFAGSNKAKTDPRAFVNSKVPTPVYRSPVTDACQKTIVIYLSNGNSSDNTADSVAAENQLASFGGNTTRIVPPDPVGGGNPGNYGDEWSRYLNQQTDLSASIAARQYATVYTVEVLPKTSLQGTYNTALLKSMASQGGGGYFEATDTASLIKALSSILAEVQAVNSVFAAASLPISVNTQGTYLNQVFLGMFRPDPKARPRWAGNLKQYQLAFDPAIDTVRLVDRNNQSAVSTITGFLSPIATSFWTTSSSFFANALSGTPPTASDAPDGEVVEKGGVAQRLRTTYATSQDARTVLTCTNATGACGGLKAFSNATMSGATYQSAFGVANAPRLSELISWARGLDNASDEAGPGNTTTVRPSVHGDVVHSRPATVDYGGATGVVVFYGANDGMLHAVSGNKPDGNGQELWSFVAPEHYGVFKRLRENTPLISFPNVLASVNPLPRNWSVDGPITIYQGGGKVYIFAAMRRGGRFLYAFDVTTPASPILMWRKSNADIPELGQTWSEPRPATLKGYANPVLIMGAGYDAAAEDVDPPVATAATTMGRGVLVLDATTGALIKSFPTTRSVPGNVTLVDSNYDGSVDRAYAADMSGRIYRFDFEDSGGGKAVANWQSSTIANLADPTNPGGRKFFSSPDIVLTRTSGALMIGSGDREKPLKTVTADRFYMVKDLLPGMPLPGGANYAATVTEAELVPATADAAVLAAAKGWYIALAANGEKVVNSPLTVAGTTFFATNRPTPVAVNSCDANLGEAKAYAVSFQSGTALLDRNGDGKVDASDTATILTAGGLPPSPVSGTVGIDSLNAEGVMERRYHLFLIGGGARGSAFEAEKPKVPIQPTRRRIYWNVVRDK